MVKYFLGVDIGGTAIKFGLFDDREVLVEKWSIDTDISDNGSKIVSMVTDSILVFFADKNIDDVGAIGLALPGPVVHGNTIKKAINLNWKKEFNISDELKSYIKKDIYIHAVNDANAAAYGEYKYGAGKGYNSMFMVTVGTGIGGGFILDDKIIEGMNGGAAEIGHIKVAEKYQRECNCGGVGCLETIAGSNGIMWLYEKNVGIKDDNVSVKDICDKAKEGNKIANDTLRESMFYIGKALATVSEIVEPECMVIGGGVSQAGDIIVNYIKDGYNQFSTMTIMKPQFKLAKLGNDAGIYGAMNIAKRMM